MRIALFVAAVVALSAVPVWAVNYRNPAHDTLPGAYWLGIHFEDQERTFDVEGAGDRDYDISVLGLDGAFGLFSGAVLNLSLGSVAIAGESLDNEMTGVEAGVQLRWNLDAQVPLDPGGNTFSQFRKGLFAGVRLGNAEDKNHVGLGYTQYDLGFGVGTPLIRQVQLYGGGVLSVLAGSGFSDDGPDTSVDSRDNIGAFAGIEYRPQDNLTVGGELHLVHEWGIGFYVEYSP